VVNLGEDAAGDDAPFTKPVATSWGRGRGSWASASARGGGGPVAEADRAELLEGLGLGEGALRGGPAAYRLLGRRTFLTTGTRRVGRGLSGPAPGPECAG